MMRFGILMFATASMFSLSAHAQTLSFGIGSASCATWKLNATRDFEGKTWILGFWSGLNAAADKANFVGIDTDPPAILAEIALICAKSPSMKLQDAARTHYFRVRAIDGPKATMAPSK
jgi:hypothetical protein